jgi:hypothetical protein
MENENGDNKKNGRSARVTLKTVADHVGLTPGTISAVLNDTPGAVRIPQATKDRITAAARELNYYPNPLARALRVGQAAAKSNSVHFREHARRAGHHGRRELYAGYERNSAGGIARSG